MAPTARTVESGEPVEWTSRQAVGRRRRGGEQPEQQERAHGLRGLRRRPGRPARGTRPRVALHWDAPRGGHGLVEAREQQWASQHQDAGHDRRADDGREPRRAARQAEDGAEQHAHAGRSVCPAAGRGVDRQEEHPESENPHEHACR